MSMSLYKSLPDHGRFDLPPDDDDLVSINVPLLVGLLSAVGTLLLALLCAAVWFAVVGNSGSIRLPGGNDIGGWYDDEQRFLEEEQDALEHMDEFSRQEYLRAKAYVDSHPPNSSTTDISLSQFMIIQEKGVSAWEFEPDFNNTNCFVESRTEIEFFDNVCCVQTNLPIPRQNDVYYWEAKIFDKPLDTVVSVGMATKPYPSFRLPGYHRYSVAYDSTGVKRLNQPFNAPHYGPPLQQGDVVGMGYRTRTGTIFFTRNGKKLEDALHGMRLNLFPTIGSTGPATIQVNFGQAGFVYIEANVKKWGLAPAQGSLAPPPPYGAENDFVLLESGHRESGLADFQTSDIDDNYIDDSGDEYGQSSRRPATASSVSSRDFAEGNNGDSINLARLDARPDNDNIADSAHIPQAPTGPRFVQHGTSGKVSLVQGSPPPIYSSETESISDIEENEPLISTARRAQEVSRQTEHDAPGDAEPNDQNDSSDSTDRTIRESTATPDGDGDSVRPLTIT